jgi:DNA-directed RNA polymerase beta' subunit
MHLEMNAHIPQSYEAAAELAEIAAVPHQIIRPRDSTPVIGVVQDALAGSYLATLPNNFFTRREFMNMMMKNKRFRELPAANDSGRYTGQHIIGTLFAPININMANSQYDNVKDPNLNIVTIQEGKFLKGVLDKDVFNKAGKGILHTTYNDYGPKAAVELLDGIQNMMETYLIMKGFSVGISDLIADEDTRKQMKETVDAKKKELDDLILSLHTDLFTNNSGKSNQEEFEGRANAILTKAVGEAGKIGVKSLSAENRLMTMVRSGSKGDENNVAQMIACLGQVAVEGKRIPYGFQDRTLPHFKMFDDGAEARGFVESSFVRGLTPTEFFFHAMAGREGLIDTAVKTAETGYTQRQLIKAMENLMTQHDGSVRDGMGKIVQFCYGEDGLASTKLENCSLPLEGLTDQDIKSKFGLQDIDFSQVLAPGVDRGADSEALKEYTNEIMKDRKMLVEGVFGSSMPYDLTASQNLERIILNIKTKFGLKKDQQTDLTPLVVLEGIQKIIDRTHAFNRRASENRIWTAALRFHLAPHKMIVIERFTKQAWFALIEAIVIKNWKAWALPGELVGIVAAQSIGEPATQMSALKSTKIVVKTGKNNFYKGEVGKFIDDLLEKNKSKVVTIGDDSVVMDLEEDIEILGVSNNEKTSWRRISQISRHPANGGMVEVHTRSGRKTTATLSHSFLKRSTTGIVPVLGSDLKIGMRVPVARKIPEVNNPIHFIKKGDTTFTLDKEFGWMCGIYLADGSINGTTVVITKIATIVEEKLSNLCENYDWELTTRYYQGAYGPSKENKIHSKDLRDFLLETFGQGSYTKQIGGLVFNAPVEFIKGVVGGYFDGDGNVNSEKQMIRAGSRSQELIRDINNLLGYCDMFGVLGQEKTKNMPGKIMYTVSIPKKFAELYKKTIGFELEEKAKELQKIIEYNDREEAHSQQEMIDKIPELGGVIAQTGKLLRMPGQSRTFGRWTKKESIGRRTLGEYIEQFKEMMNVYVDPIVEQQVRTNIAIMESALDADVMWDEIVDLVYLDDPKEYVYDFTVPGNDSFMVDDNILVHNTLNTFHQAGIAAKSAMTRGVPRLKELLKVTKNPKATSVTIKLKPAFRNDKDAVRQVSQDLELTLLKDIVEKAAIYYDPDDDDTILEEDVELIRFFKAMEMKGKSGDCGVNQNNSQENKDKDVTTYSKWILRFEFDREKMFNKNITMDDIYFVIRNIYNEFGGQSTSDQPSSMSTIYSDYNSQKLVMRIRPNIKTADFMYGDYLASIKKLLNTMMQNTIVRGVPGIRAVTWRKDSNNYEFQEGQYKKVDQYLLDTDGTNFVSIMTHPYVDGNSLYSTNLYDIFDQLGIEATRTVLYTEILNLFNRKDINYRHLGLLCDIMTHGGRPMSVDRYGINKMDNGPLAKASFEETEKVLKSAALFGEMDPVTGVSANIMMGQPIRAGTAFTQILLDEVALPKLLEGLPEYEEKEEQEEPVYTQEEMDENLYGEEDLCGRVESQMNMILPNSETRITEEEDIELVEL